MHPQRQVNRRTFLTGRAMSADPAAVRIDAHCLARAGIACMACRDSCEQEAIRFRPRIGGPFLPDIDHALCTACGACADACPAGAIAMPPRAEQAHG